MSTTAPTPELSIEEQVKAERQKLLVEMGAPTPEQIEFFKSQAPNGRVQFLSPDGKRGFICRSIGAQEMLNLNKQVPENSTSPDFDLAVKGACLCTVWTNVTKSKRCDEEFLRTGSAGLPFALWGLVNALSDYIDPSEFSRCSFEL